MLGKEKRNSRKGLAEPNGLVWKALAPAPHEPDLRLEWGGVLESHRSPRIPLSPRILLPSQKNIAQT